MHHLTIPAAALAGACMLFACALVIHRMTVRRCKNLVRPARPEPRSVVHLLLSDDELRDAIERATRFERSVAEALEQRAAHYESLLMPSLPPELRPVPVPEPDAGPARQIQPA